MGVIQGLGCQQVEAHIDVLKDEDTTSVNPTERLVSDALNPRSLSPGLITVLTAIKDGESSEIASVRLLVSSGVVVTSEVKTEVNKMLLVKIWALEPITGAISGEQHLKQTLSR